MLGYYVTGDNRVYNNLIINAGLGPEGTDDAAYHTGVHINTGHKHVSSMVVYLYNNTLYGNGWAGAENPEESGSVLFDQGAFDRSTTVYFSNKSVYSTGEPYIAGEAVELPTGNYPNCWYGIGLSPAWDTTAINNDPNFIGADFFNCQLQKGSPGIDVGRDVSTVVERDLLGVQRPSGQGFDIGVFEYFFGTVIMWSDQLLPMIFR